jgi:mannose-6-phosphate isomerase-like protein (cupin superfamily)
VQEAVQQEPIGFFEQDYNTRINREEERKHLASLPRVIKCWETPRKVSPSWGGSKMGDHTEAKGGVAVHLRWYRNDYQKLEAPVYTISCLGGRSANPEGKILQQHEVWPPQELKPKHRHFFEAAIYVRGSDVSNIFEYQDGRTWEFHGEGLLCVPTFCQHMHWYQNIPRGAGMVFQSRLFEYLGLADFEHFEVNKSWLEAKGEGGKMPNWLPQRYERLESFVEGMWAVKDAGPTDPESIYDRFLDLQVEENGWRHDAPRFIPLNDAPWEHTRQGKIKYLSHPFTPDGRGNTVLRTLDVFVQEIPPGGRTGMHRHVGEEVHYILEGRGYDIQDGQRYDWEEDCLTVVPNYTVHQHFNTDPKRPARFVAAQTRWYQLVGYGGFEQLEDAPEWKASH